MSTKCSQPTDQIVQNVIDKFSKRSAQGIAKYGTTLADNYTDDFLTHLQEELMDAVLYIEKLKQQKNYKQGYPCTIFAECKLTGNRLKMIYCVKCEITNEVYEIVPWQQTAFDVNKSYKYVLIDEFINPELFTDEPLFTDKRYAKILQ